MTAGKRKHVIQSFGKPSDRIEHYLANLQRNRAFTALCAQAPGQDTETLLHTAGERFREYRRKWTAQPAQAHEERLHGPAMAAAGMTPLCVDIELSAMCDLACPFCYRQFIATPDRLMDDSLCLSIIDQAAEMGVPSIKFNWRGEPLLHPRLPEFVAYAKDKGIPDTIINTNAVTLTEKKGVALIEAGLDFLIYSFDGGSRQSYEKMRPGRFARNSFDAVYGNIRTFHESRKRLNSPFPFTKIQMVLTEDTYDEQEAFFELFNDCVDDVSVKAYTERGGSLKDLDEANFKKVAEAAEKLGLPIDSPYYRDMNGSVHIAAGRLPCEQPFQRMSVSCDGAVSMCCYDWGIEHPIGFMAESGFTGAVDGVAATVEKAERKAAGYACFGELRIPRPHDTAEKRVTTLRDIWQGAPVNAVRKAHVEGAPASVPICRSCPFKETYVWTEVK